MLFRHPIATLPAFSLNTSWPPVDWPIFGSDHRSAWTNQAQSSAHDGLDANTFGPSYASSFAAQLYDPTSPASAGDALSVRDDGDTCGKDEQRAVLEDATVRERPRERAGKACRLVSRVSPAADLPSPQRESAELCISFWPPSQRSAPRLVEHARVAVSQRCCCAHRHSLLLCSWRPGTVSTVVRFSCGCALRVPRVLMPSLTALMLLPRRNDRVRAEIHSPLDATRIRHAAPCRIGVQTRGSAQHPSVLTFLVWCEAASCLAARCPPAVLVSSHKSSLCSLHHFRSVLCAHRRSLYQVTLVSGTPDGAQWTFLDFASQRCGHSWPTVAAPHNTRYNPLARVFCCTELP